VFYLYIGANLGAKNSTITLSEAPNGGPNHKGRGGALMPFLSNSTNPNLLKWISEKRFYLSTPFQKVVSLSIVSNDKNMHKSGWMRPSRPNVPRDESMPSKEELEPTMSQANSEN